MEGMEGMALNAMLNSLVDGDMIDQLYACLLYASRCV